MKPTYFALVPYDRRTRTSISDKVLLHVAAALQTQVVRDFSPIWGLSGVVSPFLALDDVPPEYIPIAIVEKDLPGYRRGFHFTVAGQPFAVVQYRESWSLAASHELIEMLCDPTGMNTMVGPSLADEQALLTPDKPPAYPPQGQVEYLMEVCDPCESSTYRINGVLVSDFVTPQYYDTFETDCACYSFTGRVKGPRQLLEGGYISWRSRLPANAIYQAALTIPLERVEEVGERAVNSENQATVETKDLHIERLDDVPSRFSREWIDSQTPPFVIPNVGPAASYSQANKSSAQWAKAFRAAIEELFTWLGGSKGSTRPPSLDDVIRLVAYLATETGNKAFRKHTTPGQWQAALAEYHIVGVGAPKALPAAREYKSILQHLENQKNVAGLFGPDLFDPNLALWMCMLTN